MEHTISLDGSFLWSMSVGVDGMQGDGTHCRFWIRMNDSTICAVVGS